MRVARSAEAIAPLLVILFGFEVGVSLFGPLLPLVQQEFEVSAGSVAVALSIYHGIRLLVNVPLGRLVSRSALPAMLAIGGAVMAAGGIIVAMAPEFWVVLAGRAVMGVGSALFFITVQFWISKVATPQDKAQLFSYHQISALAGTALGPVLSGAIAGWLSWRYSLLLAAVTGLMTLAASRRLVDPAAVRIAGSWRAQPLEAGVVLAQYPPEEQAADAALGWSLVLGPGLIMMALFFFHGGVGMTLLPLFGAREVGLGPAAIGGILMIGTLQRFGAALLGGRLASRFGVRPTVLWSLAALSVGVMSFLAVGSPVGLVVAVSLVSWANLGGSLVIALVTDVVPEKHWGTALGINRTMADLGAMVAPIMVGSLIDGFGFKVAFAATAAVMLAGAGAAAVLTKVGSRQ